jgi:nitrate reductase NapE component
MTMTTTAPPQVNGHARPVTLTPLPDDPGQSRTIPAKAGRRRPDGTAFIAVALFNAAMVAVVAFSGSWQHQYELSIHLGQAHWVAGMQPLSVEGLIVSATLVIWYAGRHGYRRREVCGAYLVLAAGVGQTVLMNLGADYRWPWLGPEISIWPAVAFVAAYEMAVWLVRKRQDGGHAADDVRARSGQPGKNGGDGAGLAGSQGSQSPPSPRVDKQAAKVADKVDKPAPRRTAPDSRTALDKAATAIRDNPGLVDKKAWTALGEIAGVSAKTVQRARNGTRDLT